MCIGREAIMIYTSLCHFLKVSWNGRELRGSKLPNLCAYRWLHSFLLMQSYFRIRRYFPYTLEKLQNYLFIALDCSETMLAHQLHRQSASSDFLAVYSQRLVGPVKRILLSFTLISKINFCICFIEWLKQEIANIFIHIYLAYLLPFLNSC